MKLKFDINKLRTTQVNSLLFAGYSIFLIVIFILLRAYFKQINTVTENFYNLYELQAEVTAMVEDINILFGEPDTYFERRKEYQDVVRRIDKINTSFVELKKSARNDKNFAGAIASLEADYAEFNSLFNQIMKTNREFYHPTEGIFVLLKNIENELKDNDAFKKYPYNKLNEELFGYVSDLESGKINLKIFHQKVSDFEKRLRKMPSQNEYQELVKYQYQTLVTNFIKLNDKANVVNEIYGKPYESGLFLKIHQVKLKIKQHFKEIYKKSYELILRDRDRITLVFIFLEVFALLSMVGGFYFLFVFMFKPVMRLEQYINKLATTERLEYIDKEGKMPLEFMSAFISLNKHVAHLKTKKDFVDKIRQGNLDYNFTPVSYADELGQSLEDLRQYLKENEEAAKKIREAEDRQRWITEGLAIIGTEMRKNVKDVDTLLNASLKGILNYINVPVGAVYLRVEENGQIYYRMQTAVAYGHKRVKDLKFSPNESFVGTVAVEQKTMIIDKLPPDYIFFESAYGYAKPSSVVYVPLTSEEEGILGVLEIATNSTFEEHTVSFLEAVSKDLASTIVYVRINEKTKQLAGEFQNQIANFEEKEKENQKIIAELRQKVEQLEEEVENKKRLIFNKEDIIKEKIQEIVKLRDALAQKDKEIERIQLDFEKIENSLKKHIANLEDQISKLVDDLNNCNKQS